jgi:hypothetical protein
MRVGEVPAKGRDPNGSEETSGIPPRGTGFVHLAQSCDDNSTLEKVLRTQSHVDRSLFHYAAVEC